MKVTVRMEGDDDQTHFHMQHKVPLIGRTSVLTHPHLVLHHFLAVDEDVEDMNRFFSTGILLYLKCFISIN